MEAFVAARDGGSLSAASRALNTPLPTISRRVSELEAHLDKVREHLGAPPRLDDARP